MLGSLCVCMYSLNVRGRVLVMFNNHCNNFIQRGIPNSISLS